MSTTSVVPQYDELHLLRGRQFRATWRLSGVDLTAGVWQCQARATDSVTSEEICTFITTAVLDGTDTLVTIELGNEETSTIRRNKGMFDLLYTDLTGFENSYVLGSVTITGAPTEKAVP